MGPLGSGFNSAFVQCIRSKLSVKIDSHGKPHCELHLAYHQYSCFPKTPPALSCIYFSFSHCPNICIESSFDLGSNIRSSPPPLASMGLLQPGALPAASPGKIV